MGQKQDEQGFHDRHGFPSPDRGFSLTTAEIIYRLPDHQRLLQSYIWQDYDLAPRFPKLTDFLDFWQAKSRRDAVSRARGASELISPAEFCFVEGELQLH